MLLLLHPSQRKRHFVQMCKQEGAALEGNDQHSSRCSVKGTVHHGASTVPYQDSIPA